MEVYIIKNINKVKQKLHLLSLPNKSSKKITTKSKIMNIIGRPTKDAAVHTATNSKQVVNFSVAVNDSYKTKEGERVVQTAYFDCSYWRTPNVTKMLTKGLLVELSYGSLAQISCNLLWFLFCYGMTKYR